MKKLLILSTAIALLGACQKEKYFDGPDFFEDSFENYDVLSDLLMPQDVLWSFTQLTKIENSITVDTSRVHTGLKSLKFTAKQSDAATISKCSLAKQKMAFWEGETMRVSAWYYVEGTQDLEWLFLLDLEEQTPIGAGPGIRIALVNNQLRMEYKFNEKDLVQNAGQEVDFPRNQWVEIVWEVKLSQKKKGSVKLWQNGQLIIDSKNIRTLPKDILYAQQGTKGMYSSVEIGITANTYASDLTLWVDDIKIETVE